MIRGWIGRHLVGARLTAGVTQDELAERMNTTASALSRVESGARSPSVDFVERYARALGRAITVTFGEETAPLSAEVRRELVRLSFGRLGEYEGRIIPVGAREVGMDGERVADATELYFTMIKHAVRHQTWDLRAHGWVADSARAVAVGALYYQVIDWDEIARRIESSLALRRMHSRVRRRVRLVLARGLGAG